MESDGRPLSSAGGASFSGCSEHAAGKLVDKTQERNIQCSIVTYGAAISAAEIHGKIKTRVRSFWLRISSQGKLVLVRF